MKLYPRLSTLLLTLLSLTVIRFFPFTLRRSDSLTSQESSVDPIDWDTDYETRVHTAQSLGRPQPKPIYVRWVHAPKTGTSFINTLIRWGCPTARETFITPPRGFPKTLTHPISTTHSSAWFYTNTSGRNWIREHCTPRLTTNYKGRVSYAIAQHNALAWWQVRHAVGLFRMPLQRTYSYYIHLAKNFNEHKTAKESLTSFVNNTINLSEQAKLLLGRYRQLARVITQDEALQAAENIRKMLFVGLTEEFDLSCRLFHAMFGGVPHRAQFENIRPGITRYKREDMHTADFRYDEKVFNGWRDVPDDVVYNAARERFWSDVRRYKVEIEKDGLGVVEVP